MQMRTALVISSSCLTSSSQSSRLQAWVAGSSSRAGNISPSVSGSSFERSTVKELQRAIHEFMTAWNSNPSPFVWTASVEKILEKFARCQHRLEQLQPGCTKPKRKNECVVI